jgi:signal transduction histidine kinase
MMRIDRRVVGRTAVDAAIVLGVMGLSLPWANINPGVADVRADSLVGQGLRVVVALALVFRRRQPWLTLAAVAGAEIVYLSVGFPTSLSAIGVWIAMYGVGRYGRRLPHTWVWIAATAVAIATPQLVRGRGIGDAIIIAGVDLACFAVGDRVGRQDRNLFALAEENVRLDAEQRELARRAVEEERARIARDLHDVIAHGLGLIVVQASSARHVFQGTDAEESLATIDDAARSAMNEMRTLLGVLRDDGGVAPITTGLAQLDSLMSDAARAGITVAVDVSGTRRDLPPIVDVSAYRIVQESVTNAIKHSASDTIGVTLTYDPAGVAIEVSSGRAKTRSAGGSGYGLIGMRERAAVLGGRFDAGPDGAGGFLVTAWLPTDRAAGDDDYERSTANHPNG